MQEKKPFSSVWVCGDPCHVRLSHSIQTTPGHSSVNSTLKSDVMWLWGWGHSSTVTWPFQWRSDQNKPECWCGRSDITQQLNCTWQHCIGEFVLIRRFILTVTYISASRIITKSWENNRCMQSLKIFVVKRYTEISLNEEMRQDVLYSTWIWTWKP